MNKGWVSEGGRAQDAVQRLSSLGKESKTVASDSFQRGVGSDG